MANIGALLIDCTNISIWALARILTCSDSTYIELLEGVVSVVLT